MKHLTLTVIILIVGFGACSTGETIKEPKNRSSENQSQLFPRTMYVNAEAGIRKRSAPTTDSIRIGAYSHGEKIQVLEKSSTPVTIDGITNYWYKTKADLTFEGKFYEYSWVFGGYLSEKQPATILYGNQKNPLFGKVFIGKVINGVSVYTGIPEFSAYRDLGGAVVKDNYCIGIGMDKNNNLLFIFDETGERQNGRVVSRKVLDTLFVKKLSDGENYSIMGFRGERPGGVIDIIAIYTDKYDVNKEYFVNIDRAWHINLQTGRFEEIKNLKGIKCINEGYGI